MNLCHFESLWKKGRTRDRHTLWPLSQRQDREGSSGEVLWGSSRGNSESSRWVSRALGGTVKERNRKDTRAFGWVAHDWVREQTRKHRFARENEFSLGHWLSGALGKSGHLQSFEAQHRGADQVLQVEFPPKHLCLPKALWHVRAKTCSLKMWSWILGK